MDVETEAINVEPVFTFDQLRDRLSREVREEVPRSSLYDWLKGACKWVGVKDCYTQQDLEWLIYWVKFRRTKSPRIKVFHRHIELTHGVQINA